MIKAADINPMFGKIFGRTTFVHQQIPECFGVGCTTRKFTRNAHNCNRRENIVASKTPLCSNILPRHIEFDNV